MSNKIIAVTRRPALARSSVTRVAMPSDRGRSLVFNGTNQNYVSISSLHPAQLPFSVAIWFWMSLASSNQCIVSYRSSIAGGRGGIDIFEYSTTNTLGVFGYNSSGIIVVNIHPATTFAFNTWNHVALTVDTASSKFYINGVLAGSSTGTIAIPGGQVMTLGRTSYTSSSGFTGLLKQFVYAPTIWSATEVSTLYNTGIIPASAICELRCNEYSGFRCRDTLSNNHGYYSGSITRNARVSLVPSHQAIQGRLILA